MADSDKLTPDDVIQRLAVGYANSKSRQLIKRKITQKCEGNALMRFLINEYYRHLDDLEVIANDISTLVNEHGVDFHALTQRTFTEA